MTHLRRFALAILVPLAYLAGWYTYPDAVNQAMYHAQFLECMQTTRDAGEVGPNHIYACDKVARRQSRG